MKKIDYCTWFPETWFGTYIGDCCKKHDDTCSTAIFFRCLVKKIGKAPASLITTGGAIGCWFKYTRKMFKKLW